MILLMEEILHRLGCIKTLEKQWDIYHINWLAGFLNRHDFCPKIFGRLHPALEIVQNAFQARPSPVYRFGLALPGVPFETGRCVALAMDGVQNMKT